MLTVCRALWSPAEEGDGFTNTALNVNFCATKKKKCEMLLLKVESQSKVMNNRVASVLYYLLHSCFGKVDNNNIKIENTDANHLFYAPI